MRELIYTDDAGRKFKVLIPESSPDSHAKYGLVIGPPDLSPLGLPIDTEVRLNNQLFYRGLITFKDVIARRIDVVSALQATLAVDTENIVNIYRGILDA